MGCCVVLAAMGDSRGRRVEWGWAAGVNPAPPSWHGKTEVAAPNPWRGDAEASGMLFPLLRKSLKSSRWGESSGRPLAVYCPFNNRICCGTESSCCTHSPESHSGFGQCIAGVESISVETRNIISYQIPPMHIQWFLLSLLQASSPKGALVSSNNMFFWISWNKRCYFSTGQGAMISVNY